MLNRVGEAYACALVSIAFTFGLGVVVVYFPLVLRLLFRAAH